MPKKRIYCVYDTRYYDQCVLISEDLQTVANFFKKSLNSMSSTISKKYKIKNRYIVETMKLEELEEEDE